jgi:hypothetical protein
MKNGTSHANAKQKLHCNREAAFSTPSAPKCFQQQKLGVREPLGFSRAKLLLLESGR